MSGFVVCSVSSSVGVWWCVGLLLLVLRVVERRMGTALRSCCAGGVGVVGGCVVGVVGMHPRW